MVRFDKPCVQVSGAVEYFREHMIVGDYLTEEGRVEMSWVGEGAKRLGLTGPCQLLHFQNLCEGRHPVTGEHLSPRDKGENRRVCYFAQISPPKDVSLLHLVGGDARIASWWKEAVAETLAEIETVTATRVRARRQNVDRRTGNFVGAIVTHEASRSLDPQLHTHLAVMNVTWDQEEDRWKSLQPFNYYRHQGFFREVAYNRLAIRMLAAGYELEAARTLGFQVKGVPAALRDLFSKRRREILAEAARRGASTQDAFQSITAESRAAKTHAEAGDLRRRWREEAGADLAALEATVAAANGTPAPRTPVTSLEAMVSAEAHVYERRSVVNDRILLREALIAGRGQVDPGTLRHTLHLRTRAGDLIGSGEDYTSRDCLAAENEFTGWADSQVKACGPMGRPPLQTTLAPDQAKAVTGILSHPSRVLILQGDAGTGKTASLKTIVAGIEQSGGLTFGCAPTSGATDVLRHELTPDAETLQQLLVSEALQEKVRGRIILVDEAGLISARQMNSLCRLAAQNENRLLLVGDVKQHSSIEAGDALRCLQLFTAVPVFHLTAIRRQKDPRYREAVSLLAQRRPLEALDAFKRLGAVREIPSPPELWNAAAQEYVRIVQSGKSCLAISPVWSEIREFTAHVRSRLKEANLLETRERMTTTLHSFKWTREERRRIQNYHADDLLTFHRNSGPFRKGDSVRALRRDGRMLLVRDMTGRDRRLDPRQVGGYDVGLAHELALSVGDRLLIRGNDPSSRLKNGDLVQIAAFHRDGRIGLKDGRTIPASFREFAHGYAATSHAAQGKTIDHGLLLMADEGIAAGNLKQAYVSNSRFRESQTLFVSNFADAREAMAQPADRRLAMELVVPVPRVTPPDLPPEEEGENHSVSPRHAA